LSIFLLTPPASEPLTLSQVKLHLRKELADTEEDSLLTALIQAARMMTEDLTNRQLITASWRYAPDWREWHNRDGRVAYSFGEPAYFKRQSFPDLLMLPKAPLQAITAVKYLDSSDASQTLATANYMVDIESDPGVVSFLGDSTIGFLPDLSALRNPIQVEFTAGYGTTADKIPAPIIQAMLLMVGSWYESRQDTVRQMPTAAEWLLNNYRIITFA
jgi:hypothetical protein